MSEFGEKVTSAAKWSVFGELAPKLVSPITSIVLARLLTPEAFGVVATMSMVITFAELFTDAGFQKYLIQHDFNDEKEESDSINVAFTSNLFFSLILWACIVIFNRSLSSMVGCPGLGIVLVVSCVSIPLAAFSSIQIALYKRALDFRPLSIVRIVSSLVPLFVTIPLAIWLKSYWALVFGTICRDLINVLLLRFFSSRRLKISFDIGLFKKMFSFTFWSMLEALTIWLTNYIDFFVIGTLLSQYYLGLYKTSISLVAQLIGIVTASATPVLFSSLSRLQNDDEQFSKLFFKFQNVVAVVLFPIGAGIFCFKGLVTDIFLGKQWLEAAPFIGLWALMSAITIVLSCFNSEAYRAKGRPRLSVLDQLLFLAILIPAVLISVRSGFRSLYVTRSLVRISGIVIGFVLMHFCLGFSITKMLRNVFPAFVSSVLMIAVAYVLALVSNDVWFQVFSIFICALTYVLALCAFPRERALISGKLLPGLKRRLKNIFECS